MDHDSAVTSQKLVVADSHNAPELVAESLQRHIFNRPRGVDATGDAKHTGDPNAQDEKLMNDDDSETGDDALPDDLFVSFPPLKNVPHEKNPLTVRAVVVGIVLGSLCNASNVYLGKSS